jgi:cation transport ATPase
MLAGQTMLLSLAVNVSAMEPRLRLFLHISLAAVTVFVIHLNGGPLLGALRDAWRRRRPTFDVLFATGIAGASAVSALAMRDGGAVYFEVAAILVTLHALGHRLNTRGRQRTAEALERLAPSVAAVEVRKPCGAFVTRPLATLRRGDVVRVHPGRRAPVDGRVVRGQAFVRESELTGEPFAVARRPGDALAAGAGVLDGTLEVEVSAPVGRRAVDDLGRAVREAMDRRAPLQHLADRLAAWLLPLVGAVALGTFAVWSAIRGPVEALIPAMSVLLVACPCAMGFATPLAFWNAIALLARRGVRVRSGEAVQRLAEVDRVVFDKTGTLTDVERTRVDAWFSPAVDRGEMLARIGAVERASDHPIARAVADRCADPWERFEVIALRTHPGRGVSAEVRDRRGGHRERIELEACARSELPAGLGGGWSALGAPPRHLAPSPRDLETPRRRELRVTPADAEASSFAASRRGASPRSSERVPDLLGEPVGGCAHRAAGLDARSRDGAEHLVRVRLDGRTVGVLRVDERPRPGLAEALESLRRDGVAPELSSGDAPARARRLGLPCAAERESPADKARRVTARTAAGHAVLFVGDGVNDALAMAHAHASLAVARGAPVAAAVADGTWDGADPRALPFALEVSRSAVASVRASLRYAVVYNLAGMAAAAAGLLHPVLAAVLMTASSLLVTWRAGATIESFDRASDARPGPRGRPAADGPLRARGAGIGSGGGSTMGRVRA